MCSLKFCVAVFAFAEAATSTSIYWLASGEIYFHQLARLGPLRLFHIFLQISFYPFHTTYCFLQTGAFLIFYSFFNSTKPGSVLRASHLFSLRWCPELLVCVCFLPILQNRARFCACFASHVQRFTLDLCGGMHGKLSTEGWVKHRAQCLPVAHLKGYAGKESSEAHGWASL